MMLTFLQSPVKPFSHNLSKTLSPPSSYPLFPSLLVTTTISTKCLCQPKTPFPTLATSSGSQPHSTASSHPNFKSHKSVRNPKKKTNSVINDDDKVMDLSRTNNGNRIISGNDQSDSSKQAPNPIEEIPRIKPRKPCRGRPSKEQATKNLIYNQFEQTLASIRAENPEQIFKERPESPNSDSDCDEDSNEESELEEGAKKESVEEEDPEWPLDAEVGWGIRASDFFEKYPIKNVVDNGMEIDWEGELDEGWVKEINCLEWESFAFHPSPLVLLVFQRYERAADNWKFLKELEKAAKVYWSCKDRLPPRTVKIDVNIETDLAYALNVTESDCPQLLFLKGNRLLYREKEIRCADEIVKMIAHFYYNAKRPEWVDSSAVSS